VGLISQEKTKRLAWFSDNVDPTFGAWFSFSSVSPRWASSSLYLSNASIGFPR